jgi:tetratricopeptide (TPR) repeat protein
MVSAPAVIERARAEHDALGEAQARGALGIALVVAAEGTNDHAMLERALDEITVSLALEAHPAYVWSAKSRVLYALGRNAEADAAAKEANIRGPGLRAEVKRLYDIGWNNCLGNTPNAQLEDSYTAFRRVLDLDPLHPRANWQLGVNCGGRVDTETTEALKGEASTVVMARGLYQDLTVIANIADQSKGVMDMLMDPTTEAKKLDARAQAGDFDAAWTAAMMRGLKLEGSKTVTREQIAETRLSLERALALDPTAISALIFRGLCRALSGESALAAEDCERVHRYYPKFGYAYFVWALALARDGHDKEAGAQLQNAFDQEPDMREKLARYPELQKLASK